MGVPFTPTMDPNNIGLTMSQWHQKEDEWLADVKANHKVYYAFYWLWGKRPIINVMSPWYKFLNSLHEAHRVKKAFPAGSCPDMDELLLHSVMATVVDFVEIELASEYIACNDNEEVQKTRKSFLYKTGLKQYRNREHGLEIIQFRIDNASGPEQKQAYEALRYAYHWWVDFYKCGENDDAITVNDLGHYSVMRCASDEYDNSVDMWDLSGTMSQLLNTQADNVLSDIMKYRHFYWV